MKTLSLLFFSFHVVAQATVTEVNDGWRLFSSVMFRTTFIQEINEFQLMPEFTNEFRKNQGKEITLTGYYMAFRLPEDQIILSQYSYLGCFFCGSAGPESVAYIYLKEKKPNLKVDQVISIKGKLKLNDRDANQLPFILEQAVFIDTVAR